MNIFIFVLIIFAAVTVEALFENDLTTLCCEQIGRKQAETQSNCVRFNVPKSIGRGTVSDRRYCQQLSSVCCHETLEKEHCKTGLELATSQFIKSHNSAFGSISCDNAGTQSSRQCCDICKLAILDLERSNNAQCNLARFSSSIMMTNSFNETFGLCCEQIKNELDQFSKHVEKPKRIETKRHLQCNSHTCGAYQTCVDTPNGPHCLCHVSFLSFMLFFLMIFSQFLSSEWFPIGSEERRMS